jgi:hypothetical protein
MNGETRSSSPERAGRKRYSAGNSGGGAVYVLGFIGAAVYYLRNAETFMVGIVGLLKALVWPALAVYKWLGMMS